MSHNVYLTRGLVGRDQDIDLFEQVFEQSQVVTVEAANPALDLISFAQNCSDFWVVNTGNSVSEAVIVQEPPSFNQVGQTAPPNNSLGLHSTPCTAPSHELPLMSANHESTTEDASPGEPLMERPEASCGVEDTAPPSYRALNPQLTDRNIGYYNFDAYRPSEDKNIAGFIYLLPSSHSQDALHYQEYNIGIILRPHWKGLGVAEKAMRLALDVVFAHHDVHRVQARLIDCYENAKAFTFFTRMGFSHEGTRRQAFLSPLTGEWKDVTTLAVLATDWLLFVRERRNDFQPAPKSLWDALFLRHQKEREELLRWEERRFYRSSSLETIREGIATPVPAPDRSDVETTSLSGSGIPGRPKRKLFEIGDGDGTDGTDSDAVTSEYGYGRENDYAVEDSPPKRLRSRRDEPYVTSPHVDRANTDLEEVETQREEAEDSFGYITTPKDEDIVTAQSSPEQLCETPGSSRSASLMPDSRGSSILSVPSSESELETESEDGSASSSAESSNWELVDSGENFGE